MVLGRSHLLDQAPTGHKELRLVSPVLGEKANATAKVAGRVARLYIYGHTYNEFVFDKAQPAAAPPAKEAQAPDPATRGRGGGRGSQAGK